MFTEILIYYIIVFKQAIFTYCFTILLKGDQSVKKVGVITIAFILCYVAFVHNTSSIFTTLSNAFFIIGLIYLCAALFAHARNVGFFKLITYHSYVKKQKNLIQSGVLDPDANRNEYKIMKLHEYVEERYKNPWKNGIFYKFSIPLLIISIILAFYSS
jgi:hypothetical protein